jgi:hypothetical protein
LRGLLAGFADFGIHFCLLRGGNLATIETSNWLDRGFSPQLFRLFFQVGFSALFNPDYVVRLYFLRSFFIFDAPHES